MNKYDDYTKAAKVIGSCTTIDQLVITGKYMQLFACKHSDSYLYDVLRHYYSRKWSASV